MDFLNLNDVSFDLNDAFFDWNVLIPDEAYKNAFDNLLVNNNLEPVDDNIDDLGSSCFSTINDEQPLSIDEDLFRDLQLEPEVLLIESPVSANGEQPIDNSIHGQNFPVVTGSISQMGVINEDRITHLMCPSLSDLISGNISVKQQPKPNHRFRYACDGLRFLPASRYSPMTITLPDLRFIELKDNQQLGIVMTIVTTTPGRTIVHANDIMYRIDSAIKIGYGSVFVPLDDKDKQTGEKKFPRLSILYKKSDEYTFDLIPFDSYSMFGNPEKYTTQNPKITNAAKAKMFKKEYNLLSYKIVFHLALKEANIIYISRTTCETETIDEYKVKSPNAKTLKSSLSERFSEEDNSSYDSNSGPIKKLKTDSMSGLPVMHATCMA